MSPLPDGTIEFPPDPIRRRRLVESVIGVLIANGLIWTMFFFIVVPSFRAGNPEWFALIVLSILAPACPALVALAIYRALALGNPRLRLRASGGGLRPGEALAVGWKCLGNPRRLRSLTIELEGEEWAAHVAGTDIIIDRFVFYREIVHQGNERAQMMEGNVQVRIPALAPPSFKSRNNGIGWRLRVKARVPWWPNVEDLYPIAVLPLQTQPVADPVLSVPTPLRRARAVAPPGEAGMALDERREYGYRPGEIIAGEVAWDMDPPLDRPPELRLVWFTQGKGTVDVGVVEACTLPAVVRLRQRFAFIAPAYPSSCSGRLLSLCWRLEVLGLPGIEPLRLDLVIGLEGKELQFSTGS